MPTSMLRFDGSSRIGTYLLRERAARTASGGAIRVGAGLRYARLRDAGVQASVIPGDGKGILTPYSGR
jgi:hypothetical protein